MAGYAAKSAIIERMARVDDITVAGTKLASCFEELIAFQLGAVTIWRVHVGTVIAMFEEPIDRRFDERYAPIML
jgi:hypothetical protein